MPPSDMAMSRRHCRTLCAIFAEPTRANVEWTDFIALVRALGGELSKPGKTSGSRQRISLRGRKAVLHKPHPEPTMKKGSVESARAFLKSAGATPEKEGCKC